MAIYIFWNWNKIWFHGKSFHLARRTDYLNNKRKISMECSRSWEANWSLTSHVIPYILCDPKVLHSIYKCLLPVPIPGQINLVHAPHPTSWKSVLIFFFHLYVGFYKWSPSLRFPHQNPVCISSVRYTCYMYCPSHFSLLDHLNDICWKVQIIKLSQCEWPGFTLIHNNMKMSSYKCKSNSDKKGKIKRGRYAYLETFPSIEHIYSEQTLK
jgi:hypothetical protein